MQNHEANGERKKRYEPPSVVEVHVDPHKELLLATACGLASGSPSQACVINPFT